MGGQAQLKVAFDHDIIFFMIVSTVGSPTQVKAAAKTLKKLVAKELYGQGRRSDIRSPAADRSTR
jgi:hypothetical protein